ncbi:hypothetical protein [Chitinophaga nivalis]|uniref:Glycosyltransferase subfamily 4-like N-terminal domain-containing protein n=1 Tax=Chitinophaga nivalis TaxID=2991709 RepID=A0ABT3INX4_9BACT|nr:hypothetical protein [Chitinophaga nivalis]MCW3464667.1 hypothetical protein [Chitinophaga nivalis]MCW3485642.1 hypothetical protein [Chitinophaga nivalis]
MPPPIGGVTIHIQRLKQYLDHHGYAYSFVDIRRTGKGALWQQIRRHRYIHFHIYSPVVRLAAVVLGRLLGKKMLFTLHGNLGRHNFWKNQLDKLAFRMAYMPIVLNEQSMEQGRRLNARTCLAPAFIPPQQEEHLSPELQHRIQQWKASCRLVCATNASNYTVDKEGRETYQISLLIKIFQQLPQAGLIISDPSGNYKKFLQQTGCTMTPNILLISEAHSFYEILKGSDVLLRITTTDGDSLSVKEALYLHKQVLATDVISRPAGVTLVPLQEEKIRTAIQALQPTGNRVHAHDIKHGGEAMLRLYEKLAVEA